VKINRHFRLPLITTGIVFLLVLILGIVGVTMIHRSDGSRRRKHERARELGSGMGVATCLVVAPFWLVAAAKVGKERREAREAAKASQGEPV